VTWNFRWRSSGRRRTIDASLLYAAFLVVADDHVGQDCDEQVVLPGASGVVLGVVYVNSGCGGRPVPRRRSSPI
jgi:hypothetical protein